MLKKRKSIHVFASAFSVYLSVVYKFSNIYYNNRDNNYLFTYLDINQYYCVYQLILIYTFLHIYSIHNYQVWYDMIPIYIWLHKSHKYTKKYLHLHNYIEIHWLQFRIYHFSSNTYVSQHNNNIQKKKPHECIKFSFRFTM